MKNNVPKFGYYKIKVARVNMTMEDFVVDRRRVRLLH